MSKTTVIRGSIILKEDSLAEDSTDRILTYDPSTGVVGYRQAIDTSALINSTLTAGQIIVGNASNVAAKVAMSGDVTINSSGVTAIGSGVIVNADVNASAAIAYSKLALTGSIVNADINSSAAIAYSKLNLSGSIVNADIAAGAAIARSKIASGTAYRIVTNGATGALQETSITASRAIVADSNGLPTASTTTATEIGYVNGVTSSIQSQLDNLIATQTVNAIVKAPTVTQDGYAITWDDGAGEYTLSDPVTQGIPVGGSTRQFLGKNSGTNYDASWLDLEVADLSDLSASAADLNVLQGADAASITPTTISYLSGISSNVQTQLDNKLSSALAQNSVFVGNASNVAAAVSAGTNGQVFTIVSGVPSWATPTTSASAGATDELQKNNGLSGFDGSKIFSTTDGSLTMGDSATSGSSRSIAVEGSAPNVGLNIYSKGTGAVIVYPGLGGGSGQLQLYGLDSGTNLGGSIILTPTDTTISKSTSNTNTVGYIKLSHTTTGTPATGIGTGLQFETETSLSNNEIGAVIEAVTTDATAASEDFDLVFKTMAAGSAATERVRIGSTNLASEVPLRLDSTFTQRDNTVTNFLEHNQVVATLGTTAFKSANFDYAYPLGINSTALIVCIDVVARRDGSNEAYAKRMMAAFKMSSGGTLAQVGTTTNVFEQHDFTGTTPTATLSVSGSNIRIAIDSNNASVNLRANTKFTLVSVAEA